MVLGGEDRLRALTRSLAVRARIPTRPRTGGLASDPDHWLDQDQDQDQDQETVIGEPDQRRVSRFLLE